VTARSNPLGCVLAIAVGGASAVGLVWLTANAFATCDVGINAGANGFTLLIALPIL
jgi:hypothetical protein